MTATKTILRFRGTLLRKDVESYEIIIGDSSEAFFNVINRYGSAGGRLRAAQVMEAKNPLWIIRTGTARPKAFLVTHTPPTGWIGPQKGKVAIVGKQMTPPAKMVPSCEGLEVDFYIGVEE